MAGSFDDVALLALKPYFGTLITSMTGATITGVVYGIDVRSPDGTGYLEVVEKAMRSLADTATTGSYLGTLLQIHHMSTPWITQIMLQWILFQYVSDSCSSGTRSTAALT